LQSSWDAAQENCKVRGLAHFSVQRFSIAEDFSPKTCA
jgi:hypothetical protein